MIQITRRKKDWLVKSGDWILVAMKDVIQNFYRVDYGGVL